MHKWVEGGRYARFFDNLEDTITVERFQVFDFEAMRSFPAVLEPLLFYVLHRVTSRIQDPAETATFKLCVMDEAWRFIQHPTLRDYVQEGLKTWRKRNAAMLLSTQTIDDFASADLLRCGEAKELTAAQWANVQEVHEALSASHRDRSIAHDRLEARSQGPFTLRREFAPST